MPASPYVSRINQIDAAQLDDEIYKVLRNQVREITKYQSLNKIDKWQPEIDAILKALIWSFSLRRGKSTFGQELLNLQYANIDQTKSVLYLLLMVLPAYAREKIVDRGSASEDSAGRTFKSVFDHTANVVKLLEFANLLIFLHRGTQPRVIENVLGISSGSITSHRPRSIGYSYMTRELLWHGLMELFAMGLPMINFHYLKQTAKRLLQRKKAAGGIRSYPRMSPSTKCAYCNDSPILPCHAGCEHIFCYYCLQAHFTAVTEFQCQECGTELRAENMKSYSAPSVAVD